MGTVAHRIRSSRKPAPNAPVPSAVQPNRVRWIFAAAVLVLAGLGAAFWMVNSSNVPPQAIRYEVVRELPHDPRAFCQGLVYENGTLFEGTGKYGSSTLRRVELETGKVLQRHALHDRLFGEGIVVWGDQIVQLTWRSEVGITYNKQTFAEEGRFRYAGQGWGITHDGKHWIMSDGTPTLRYIDPNTKQVVRHLTVHSGRRRIGDLNELEFVRGEIFANVFQKNYIVRISPRNGEVTGVLDLSKLYPQRRSREDVLNGIAYDAEQDRLFVTGKNWSKLFQLRLVP